MIALPLAPVVLSALMLAAHFLRSGEWGLVAVSLAGPILLTVRRRWVVRALQAGLVVGAALWIRITFDLIGLRQSIGAAWGRMALILGMVAAVTAGAALILESPSLRRRYCQSRASSAASAGAFLLTFAVLTPVQLMVDPPGLLLERFVPTAGWLEILGLSVYAAWLVERMLDPARSPSLRRRVWLLFSLVFFGQLAVGLAGIDRFLMTGKLHLPVPALIVAGPIFRGNGFFMPILFTTTVVLVGSAWCSHLCYIGAWDDVAARAVKRPSVILRWRRKAQFGILGLVVGAAVLLRRVGAPWQPALGLAAAFGLGGLAIMALWSRRSGVMTHCSLYCPLGVVSTVLGRINPFRVRIGDSCTDCGACRPACRYDALGKVDIARRRPGPSCTLCGDCVSRCRDGQIGYRFPGLSAWQARAVFLVLVVSLHAAFLGVARI